MMEACTLPSPACRGREERAPPGDEGLCALAEVGWVVRPLLGRITSASGGSRIAVRIGALLRPSPGVRLWLVGIGAAMTIALGSGLALRAAGVTIGRGNEASPHLTAPPWQEGAAQCRPIPMAHVHDPTRFIVVARCSTASGTVQSVHLNPDDGDLNVLVTLDSAYRPFLTAANEGVMTVSVIPTDQPSVRAPKPGQHATFYGAWVVEKVGHGVGAAALHPCWRIDVSGSAAAATSSSADSQSAGPSPSPR